MKDKWDDRLTDEEIERGKWFNENFFDIRRHKPKKGQILAQFRSCAFFVDGWVKRNVMDLLRGNKAGAESAQKVMRNLVCATEIDSIRVPLEMTEDMLKGMRLDDIAEKEYKMVIEYSYWTQKEHVPTDDPHWSVINILNAEDEKHFKFEVTGES